MSFLWYSTSPSHFRQSFPLKYSHIFSRPYVRISIIFALNSFMALCRDSSLCFSYHAWPCRYPLLHTLLESSPGCPSRVIPTCQNQWPVISTGDEVSICSFLPRQRPCFLLVDYKIIFLVLVVEVIKGILDLQSEL